ncbi:MAG: PilN domain-containing protein [Aestuariivirga sp.]|uniref:PilN domain-containing protein n=1 Tax=Aestuariivirga sp. TaxID=2650926 RepID=UPI0025B93E5C|nr:PilN domain-containing protein [Aestuariivirga sp.]MCA3561120.1 PilN domain-containing protein [Aestuariivirga sp.]
MDDSSITLSFASIWNGLRSPVLALAEELALRRASGEQPAVEIRVHAGGLEVLRHRGGAAEVLLSAAGRPQAALLDIIRQLARGLGSQAALSFAADQSVSQQIVLPQQPDAVLRAIVRNKVESLAPWPLAQCLHGMRASAIAGDPQHVRVDVAVVSRSLLEDLAATLRRAGVEVKAVSVQLPDGQPVAIDLGGDDVRREARAHAARLARTAAAVLALLTGLGLLWIYRTSSEATRLEAETASLMGSLKPGGTPAGETPQVSAANRLFQARQDRLSAVAVLNELSKLLPDNVHLLSLDLEGDQITIKGQGSGVPDLIQLLEASPEFEGVNFAAATELDQNSNADVFSLVATLAKAPPPGGVP